LLQNTVGEDVMVIAGTVHLALFHPSFEFNACISNFSIMFSSTAESQNR
jgi:hypothetical protein